MLIQLNTSQQTDEQLMWRAANGSEKAFEELYNRHVRRLQGFFARRLGDEAMAADLTHDTFLRLYAVRDTYRKGSSMRTWLYTIAYNLLKNYYRHQRPVVDVEMEYESDGSDPDLDMDTATLYSALGKVLEQLPETYAMLFSLHYEEELTIPEIASIVQMPEGTVKSRLHKVMNTIKRKLKPYENH